MSSKLRLIVVATSAGLLGVVLASRQQNDGERLFRDVLSIVSNRFIEQMDGSQLLEKAARGLLDELDDPYAHLYSPKEQDEFTQQHQGNYGGVGMTIEDRDGVHTVTRVFRDTPAERAGMAEGDRIYSVNDSVVRGWPIEKVTGRIKGPPGSKVTIEFERGTHAPAKSTMTRAIVSIPAVPFAVKIDDVGYIPLGQFGESSSDEVAKSLAELRRQGAKAFVLDLRGNGGGLLDEAVEISDLFLPTGKRVVIQRERRDSTVWNTRDAEQMGAAPLVVLVDAGTASASEIVAGALQDHDRALVIGQPTYGKGVVQTAYRVGGGSILKLTTGEWFTPAGRSIHRKREKVNGQWSVVSDSTAPAQLFQSDAGRSLRGGGGINPDLEVKNDTTSLAERRFIDAIRTHSQDFYLAYSGLAAELKSQVKPGFTVQPGWHDELYQRMQARNVVVSREIYDGAREYISDLLAYRVARNAFGDGEAKRMFADRDRQLMEALKLLKVHQTQSALMRVSNQGG
ncbi:MAG TPA: S41 family peptidase [Longimicrobiales bacterium]|nr:S41 family peptidase [Longimicrobiales bacterium]